MTPVTRESSSSSGGAHCGGLRYHKAQDGVPVERRQYKPVRVAQLVEAASLSSFKASHETSHFWRRHNIQPPAGDPNPQNTRADFCAYDKAHRDYLYTEACVKWLIKKCSSEKGFLAATGLAPKLKRSN
jgi:hypothetical protein